MNTELMDQVAATGSKNKKIELLAGCDELDKKMLRWALDPGITFGITLDQDEVLNEWMGQWGRSHAQWWNEFDNILAQLSTRKLTGHAALEAATEHIYDAMYRDDAIWACRIVNKDLRSGFSESTLNKVFPGIIEPFKVALAKPYEPEKHELAGAWCIEPKLDGLRMVLLGGVAYTRNGRTIETVDHIKAELKHLSADYVFDGEVMGVGEFDEASGDIRRKGTGANTDIYYNVFDAVLTGQWATRQTPPLRDRKTLLKKLFHALADYKHVRVVESMALPQNPTSKQLFEMRDEMMKRGYEGAMIKDLDAPYAFKRSDGLLKLKDFVDADGTITDVQEGRGKHKGKLGAVFAEFDGVVTRVGSGFTDDQRERLWKTDIKGEVIEVQYQNKTPDGKLRFPVFIRFRQDKA